jgi:hypothetical protein
MTIQKLPFEVVFASSYADQHHPHQLHPDQHSPTATGWLSQPSVSASFLPSFYDCIPILDMFILIGRITLILYIYIYIYYIYWLYLYPIFILYSMFIMFLSTYLVLSHKYLYLSICM